MSLIGLLVLVIRCTRPSLQTSIGLGGTRVREIQTSTGWSAVDRPSFCDIQDVAVNALTDPKGASFVDETVFVRAKGLKFRAGSGSDATTPPLPKTQFEGK